MKNVAKMREIAPLYELQLPELRKCLKLCKISKKKCATPHFHLLTLTITFLSFHMYPTCEN